MVNTVQKTAIANHPAQSGKNACVSRKAPPLAEEMLKLEDNFTEYSEISAFLCHALASALSDHEIINADVIAGARRCSNWLQIRSAELKDDIKNVRARHVAWIIEAKQK